MRKQRVGVVVLAVSAVLTSTGGPAHAAHGTTIALWNMNEPTGSPVMHDASGNGHDGRIGDEVTSVAGGGFRFGKLQPDTPPTHPQHLVVVPDSRDLDPGDRDYAVELRLRTQYKFGNIIQKGQATVAGGSFKLQIPSGHVQCLFRGSNGTILVTAPNAINDGGWHVVRCERAQDGVFLSIDGDTVATHPGWTGPIANSWPLTIGGKPVCDQVSVGCDYFAGDIDYVRLEATPTGW